MTTYLNSFTSAKIGGRRRIGIAAAIFAAFCFTGVSAQAPVAPSSVSAPQSAEELENLVGRIALYPDDLVAVILPASTHPLQIVQADRFLDKRKADPKLKYDEGWDDSVKTLLNYPEIVKSMSTDLDWTSDLGEAVVADQGEVLAAIQTFRRKTQAAGNLKSDAKQIVVVEKEVIKIVPADPQVIYVPQYNPTTVVVYGGYTSYGYYPYPYPSYYYPYPPGAALATGIIFGAALGAAWNGNHYGWNNGGGNNNININRNTSINTGNINSGNINRGNSAGNTSNWKSNKQPGQVGSSVGKTSSTRGAGYGSGGSAGGARGSQSGASAGNMGGRGTGGGSSAASQNLSGMGSAGSANRSAGGGNSSFGGYGSGRQTGMDSSRGASSRGSMSGGGRSMGGGGRGGGGGGRGGGGRR